MTQNLPDGASFELRTERVQNRKVQFSGNQFERIESADRLSKIVRLQHEGKLSTASSSKPGGDDELIKRAAETVRYGSEHTVPFVGETQIADMNLSDDTSLTSKQMIDMMGSFVSDVRALDDRLVVWAVLSSTRSDISLKTSLGFDHGYSKSSWQCSGSIELTQGDDLLSLWDAEISIRPDFDLGKIKDNFAKTLEYAKNVVPFTPGAYPVIFTPGEVGNIINPFLASLNGMAVYRQLSPWGDKLGQQILDKRITLVDDGSVDGAWASLPFDSEGTPTRRNVLIQNGCPNTLLLDRKFGALLGKESTGNAGISTPSKHYLSLAPGTKSVDELISSIDCGLLIDGTMGAWSGNPYTGVVSGTISMGLKIEKGKIVGRVKDCMFTVNAFEHFNKHLIDLSSDVKEWGNLFPYVMLDQVVISTK